MEGGRGMEGLFYFFITLACIAGIPILILICSLIPRIEAEMNLKALRKKYKAMRAEYEALLTEKVAMKQVLMQFSDEYPSLYLQYEEALKD